MIESQQTFCSVTGLLQYDTSIVKFLDSEVSYVLDVWMSLSAVDVPVSLAPSPQFTVYLNARRTEEWIRYMVRQTLSYKQDYIPLSTF